MLTQSTPQHKPNKTSVCIPVIENVFTIVLKERRFEEQHLISIQLEPDYFCLNPFC